MTEKAKEEINYALNDAGSEVSDSDSDEDLKVAHLTSQDAKPDDTIQTESDDCLRPINPFEDMNPPITPSMR